MCLPLEDKAFVSKEIQSQDKTFKEEVFERKSKRNQNILFSNQEVGSDCEVKNQKKPKWIAGCRS